MTTETDSGLQVWRELADRLVGTIDGVEHGRMMSSDAVTWGGKVFAFHTPRGRFIGMGFRIGRDNDPGDLGVAEWEHLAPVKSRPPMWDWVLVPPSQSAHWEALARLALKQFTG